jgi:hypothetical protein
MAIQGEPGRVAVESVTVTPTVDEMTARTQEFMSKIDVEWRVAGHVGIWVVKVPPPEGSEVWGYVRSTSSGTLIAVSARDMATRFDSAVWAKTIAVGIPGAKVIRLKRKSDQVWSAAWVAKNPNAEGAKP